MKRIKEWLGGRFGGGRKPFVVAGPFAAPTRRDVAAVCREFALADEARPHLDGNPPPEAFLERLVRADLGVDAVRFLAYALPEPDAVRWACRCVRTVFACCTDPASAAALVAAETWVDRPEAARRDVALQTGRRQKFEMPAAAAAWTAMAAGWAGGEAAASPDAENAPTLPPRCSAHAAAGAILLAASAEPDRAAARIREFLELGVRIAHGKPAESD